VHPRRLTIEEDIEPQLAIAPGEIHLWLAYYDEIADPHLHARYRRLLDAEELRQEPRFYFARDRRRYLVTRALVRTVLSRYLPVAAQDWSFSTNAYGRPCIANESVADTSLSFNISHTHSLIVLALAGTGSVGVDVENLAARKAPIDIADHYFAPEEVAALRGVPESRQQFRFYEYWTFKESYIKARSMGLSLPLDKFSFRFPGEDAVRLSIEPELADDAARWRLWQFQPRPEYLVALCAERVAARPSVTVRQIVPLVGERVLAPDFLRTAG
jgi:4'-phosphopantetheinyl transferase